MSDSGFYTEQWLLENIPDDLRSDILVKGAPQDGPSGDTAFLTAVRPKAVVASATQFPESQQISANLVETLRSRGIRLFAQDRCGAVMIRVFPNSWEVSAFLNGQQYCHAR